MNISALLPDLSQTFMGLPLATYLVVAAVAAVASIVGGVAGYGTGMLLPLALIPAIGAEATVPVLGVTAIFTNLGRIAAFRSDIDWPKAWRIALPALPGVVIGASFNTWLSGRGVLVLLGLTLLAMIPLRKWLQANGLKIPDRWMPLIGFAFGILMGGTTGSGVLLIGFLGGMGLVGPALIATDAVVTVIAGSLKSLTYGTLGALTPELFVFAVIIGLVTMPSGFVARAILKALPLKVHTVMLDGVIIVGAATILLRGLFG